MKNRFRDLRTDFGIGIKTVRNFSFGIIDGFLPSLVMLGLMALFLVLQEVYDFMHSEDEVKILMSVLLIYLVIFFRDTTKYFGDWEDCKLNIWASIKAMYNYFMFSVITFLVSAFAVLTFINDTKIEGTFTVVSITIFAIIYVYELLRFVDIKMNEYHQ